MHFTFQCGFTVHKMNTTATPHEKAKLANSSNYVSVLLARITHKRTGLRCDPIKTDSKLTFSTKWCNMKSSKGIPTEKIKVTGEDLMGTSHARMPLLSGTRQNTAIDLLLLSHTAQMIGQKCRCHRAVGSCATKMGEGLKKQQWSRKTWI